MTSEFGRACRSKAFSLDRRWSSRLLLVVDVFDGGGHPGGSRAQQLVDALRGGGVDRPGYSVDLAAEVVGGSGDGECAAAVSGFDDHGRRAERGQQTAPCV